MKTTPSSIEPLEARIAPASVINFTDSDGDKVKFTSSNGDLTGHINPFFLAINSSNTFDVDLTSRIFAGTDFTVSVTKMGGGDGIVIIGHVDAGLNNLGTVKIAGDLGDIDAGNADGEVPGIKSLTVNSLGRFDQRGNGDKVSIVLGHVGSLVVKGDMIDTYFQVNGNLTSASIGGSLIGGDAQSGGEIYATGNLGKVSIKHDLVGGKGDYSGSVGAGRNVASVTIGGSIFGGDGYNSGNVFGAYNENARIEKVTVGGSLIGGDGLVSGVIGGIVARQTSHKVELGTVVIGGDIVGAGNNFTGLVYANLGSLDHITVKGSVFGGSGPGGNSGGIRADGSIRSITIAGSVHGGSGTFGGIAQIFAGARLDTITIGGSLTGGAGDHSGAIRVVGDLGIVSIQHDLRGDDGPYSGSIGAGRNVGSVTVGGSVVGGKGDNSGDIYGAYALDGRISNVTVGGSVVGGAGLFSGTIGGHNAANAGHYVSLGTVVIGKDLVGGSASISAGAVWAYGGSLDHLTLKGSLIGGMGEESGLIYATALNEAGDGSTISILGSVYGGEGRNSARISCGPAIEVLAIGGSLFGGSSEGAGAVYVPVGKIGLLKIHGDVRGASGRGSGIVYVPSGITTKLIGGAVIPGTGPASGVVTG